MKRVTIFALLTVASLISNSTLALPVYTPAPENISPNIAVSIQNFGAAPQDSDSECRWYSSYQDRFDIEFEGVIGSADIHDFSDWDAISNALDTWQTVSGSSIVTTLNYYNYTWAGLNSENEIGWIENGWTTLGNLGLGENVIGVALTWYDTSTLIQLETDILFNGENFSWYTDSDDSGTEDMFVGHIALHELGHALSLTDLYDSADSDRTMYGYSGYRDEDITLAPGDIAALGFAYPIPEPAAISLLGLGSLALFRKRKA